VTKESLAKKVFDKDSFEIRDEFFYSGASRLFFTQAAVVNSPPTVALRCGAR
jgi:hypothetical protein